MDPNQNQNQTIPNPTPPQAPVSPTAGNVPPVQPASPNASLGGSAAPPAPPNVPSAEDPKSNGKIILFIVVSILLLIVLGVIYFMATQLNNQYKTERITPTPTQALPTSTPTPTPLSEKDIDTIDLGNPEADLKTIDEDVKQL